MANEILEIQQKNCTKCGETKPIMAGLIQYLENHE